MRMGLYANPLLSQAVYQIHAQGLHRRPHTGDQSVILKPEADHDGLVIEID